MLKTIVITTVATTVAATVAVTAGVASSIISTWLLEEKRTVRFACDMHERAQRR